MIVNSILIIKILKIYFLLCKVGRKFTDDYCVINYTFNPNAADG